jgi:hypothetical protein
VTEELEELEKEGLGLGKKEKTRDLKEAPDGCGPVTAVGPA